MSVRKSRDTSLVQMSITCFMVMWLLVACSASPARNEQLTEVVRPTENPYSCPSEGQTETLENLQRRHIFLACPCITSVSDGPSWEGLRIGQSSLADVESVLGMSGNQDEQLNGWWFVQSQALETWGSVEACFFEQKLSIFLVDRNQAIEGMRIDDLVDTYGKPNRVTWGWGYSSRALVWSERGLVIFSNLAGRPNATVLYSPIPGHAIEESWLMTWLPDERLGSVPEDVNPPEGYEVEDPWGIEQ